LLLFLAVVLVATIRTVGLVYRLIALVFSLRRFLSNFTAVSFIRVIITFNF
jgi:hypothetical protein